MKHIMSVLILLLSINAHADFSYNLYDKIGFGADSKVSFEKDSYTSWQNKQFSAPSYEDNIDSKYKFPKTNEELYSKYIKVDASLGNSYTISSNYLSSKDSPTFLMTKRRVDYALNSEYVLREFMLSFWFNHFYTDVSFSTVNSLFSPDYEDKLRAHVFGNFKDILKIVSTSPSMLYFLDNYQNKVSTTLGIKSLNENYAREFLELHTMGVDSGYSQEDVINLAKILSGHQILLYDSNIEGKNIKNAAQNYVEFKNEIVNAKRNRGKQLIVKDFYVFNPIMHDNSDKYLLGKKIKQKGIDELDEAIKIIVSRSETAIFLSTKLANYFMSTKPSKELIDNLAKTFRSSNGDIKLTLITLLNSDEFLNDLEVRSKFKDSFYYIVSTIKSPTFDNIRSNNSTINLATNYLFNIKAQPFTPQTPDGINFSSKFWSSPTRMEQYLYFTNMFYSNSFFANKNYIDYKFISKISDNDIESQPELINFLSSERWLYR